MSFEYMKSENIELLNLINIQIFKSKPPAIPAEINGNPLSYCAANQLFKILKPKPKLFIIIYVICMGYSAH